MPARERDREAQQTEDSAKESAPPAEAQETTFNTEGEIPAVSDVAVTPTAATASELAFDAGSSDTSFLDTGIHDWEDYKTACERAGKPDKWHDRYKQGHTSATQLTQKPGAMEWSLKNGHSASQAVRDFLKGPTIADYRAAGVAGELDELRDDLGDIKFDKLFGSSNEQEDRAISRSHRLQITADMYTTPFVDQMKAIAAQADQTAGKPSEPVVAASVENKEEKKDKPEEQHDQQHAAVVAKELGVERHEREIV